MKVDKEITEDEAALYDRQIRLWGVDAQRRLLSSRILLINMQGLGAEIAKNLVLGGVNCLTLLDSNEVKDQDLRFNFLIPRKSVGKNRAEACVESLQTLNPLVKVVADTEKLESKDESYFSDQNFDLVCALINDTKELERINGYCRKSNVLFLSGHVFGSFGYLFVDLNEFSYISEVPKIDEDTDKKKPGEVCCTSKSKDEKKQLEEKTLKYGSYKEFIELLEKPLESLSANKIKRFSKAYFLLLFLHKFYQLNNRNFLESFETVSEDCKKMIEIKNSLLEQYKIDTGFISDNLFNENDLKEFAPVNAILGGTIAQEVIKAISKKNDPIQNLFVFDGNVMAGEVVKV